MKTQAYLEHNNITVNNIDETTRFLQTAMPEFEIRGGGVHNGRRWIHIGTEHSYLAVNEATIESDKNEAYSGVGFNHMGFVVDNVEAVGKRLLEAGYKRDYPLTEQKYRIRDYFIDTDGNEYEFIQYLSDKPEERNSYED
ncbi:MAG: VOC family protein [Flavobacteriales bacterium]|nr:VOC family protein [Flavobacteriales bacterium]MCB9204335.1 VOC family protein [Flavobacteriales bacterium]